MRSKGIGLLGLARTVRTVGGDGEHPDFRNLVEVRLRAVPLVTVPFDDRPVVAAVGGWSWYW